MLVENVGQLCTNYQPPSAPSHKAFAKKKMHWYSSFMSGVYYKHATLKKLAIDDWEEGLSD
jgi:hypothetical protein